MLTRLVCAPGARRGAERQADQLADAQPGLDAQVQQEPVTAPQPGAGVRGGDERFGLGGGEERHERGLGAFRGDREDLADRGDRVRCPVAGVGEERPQRRPAGVAGRDGVPALGFQVLEEPADQVCVEIGQRQRRWRDPGGPLSVGQ